MKCCLLTEINQDNQLSICVKIYLHQLAMSLGWLDVLIIEFWNFIINYFALSTGRRLLKFKNIETHGTWKWNFSHSHFITFVFTEIEINCTSIHFSICCKKLYMYTLKTSLIFTFHYQAPKFCGVNHSKALTFYLFFRPSIWFKPIVLLTYALMCGISHLIVQILSYYHHRYCYISSVHAYKMFFFCFLS